VEVAHDPTTARHCRDRSVTLRAVCVPETAVAAKRHVEAEKLTRTAPSISTRPGKEVGLAGLADNAASFVASLYCSARVQARMDGLYSNPALPGPAHPRAPWMLVARPCAAAVMMDSWLASVMALPTHRCWPAFHTANTAVPALVEFVAALIPEAGRGS
jgi:hypothetical protein